jgi:hypothetical protein
LDWSTLNTTSGMSDPFREVAGARRRWRGPGGAGREHDPGHERRGRAAWRGSAGVRRRGGRGGMVLVTSGESALASCRSRAPARAGWTRRTGWAENRRRLSRPQAGQDAEGLALPMERRSVNGPQARQRYSYSVTGSTSRESAGPEIGHGTNSFYRKHCDGRGNAVKPWWGRAGPAPRSPGCRPWPDRPAAPGGGLAAAPRPAGRRSRRCRRPRRCGRGPGCRRS